MMIAFTIIEIKLFNGKPILRCDAPPFRFIFVVLSCFGCAICLVSGKAIKEGMASQNHSPYFRWGTSG